MAGQITANEQQVIKLGMSAPLTGPSAQLGHQLKLGAEVYFNAQNLNGGINGQRVQLVALDDQYEPKLTANNTRHFLFDEHVFALFNYVGTPTSHAVYPFIKDHQIPFFTPFTGAEFLRTPEQPNIVHVRASYNQEAHAQIEYLVKHKKHSRIALFIQADEFGLSVEKGLINALASYNLQPVTRVRFKRNTVDIADAISKLKEHQIDAICMVGTYQPLSLFVNEASRNNIAHTFTSVSFVSSKDLFDAVKEPSEVVVTEVIPDISHCNSTWCQELKQKFEVVGITKPTRIHIEGYLNAHFFSNAAKACPSPLQQECVLAQAKNQRNKIIEMIKTPEQSNQYSVADTTVFFSITQTVKAKPN